MGYDLRIFDGDVHCVIDDECRLSDCNIDLETELSAAEFGFRESQALISFLRLWDWDPVLVAALIARSNAGLQLCIDSVLALLPVVEQWWPSAVDRVEAAIDYARLGATRCSDREREQMKPYFELAADEEPRSQTDKVTREIAQAVLGLLYAKMQQVCATTGRYADPLLLEHSSQKMRFRTCAAHCREAMELAGRDVEDFHCWQTRRLLDLALGRESGFPFYFEFICPALSPLRDEYGITSFESAGVLAWR